MGQFWYSSGTALLKCPATELLFMRCMTSDGICRGFAFKYGKFPLPLRYRTALSVPKVPTMYSNYSCNYCIVFAQLSLTQISFSFTMIPYDFY